jgi:hypothetical protein
MMQNNAPRRLHAHILAVLISVALTTACGGSSDAATQAVDQNATTVVAQSAPTVISAPTPSQLRDPSATVDLGNVTPGDGECPKPAQPATPPTPAQFNAVSGTLLDFLSAGASIEAVSAAMQTWGVKFAAPGSNEPLGSIEYARILPSESQQVIAAFFDPAPADPASGTVSKAGNLAVFACNGGRYTLVYDALADKAFDGLVTDPRVLAIDDVTGDGVFDLSFLTGTCQAATCMDGVTILSAHGGGGLRNIAQDFAYVPYPTFEFVQNANNTRDLIVVEGTLGDPGAGPQRGITATWSFNGQAFVKASELREVPTYRIHALHDGDDAMRRKDYRLADAFFTQVANDPALQPWEANPNAANEGQILAAFAYSRLMQSAAHRNDATGVQAAYDSLNRVGPADSPGYLYAQLGSAFLQSWNATQNAAQACTAMIAAAQTLPNASKWLGIESFGTANFDYQPEDLCISP